MSGQGFQKFLVRFAAGEHVFREGDAGDTMYVVQTGKVRLLRETRGARHELGVMEKGDFFGEMSVLEALPRSATAEVLEDAELIEISGATFDRMIRGNIEIAVRLMRKLSARLREVERKLTDPSQPAGAASGRAPQAVLSAPHPPSAGIDGARLESEDGKLVFVLGAAESLIGRYDPVTDTRPDVDLTAVDLKRTVSRRHARVVPCASGYALIEEVGAVNGTFVNGERLASGEPHELSDGDLLGLGTVRMHFRV